jgi:hypothetical protein
MRPLPPSLRYLGELLIYVGVVLATYVSVDYLRAFDHPTRLAPLSTAADTIDYTAVTLDEVQERHTAPTDWVSQERLPDDPTAYLLIHVTPRMRASVCYGDPPVRRCLSVQRVGEVIVREGRLR